MYVQEQNAKNFSTDQSLAGFIGKFMMKMRLNDVMREEEI